MKILVTGSGGFIGKHLVEALGRLPDADVVTYDVGSPQSELDRGLRGADVVYHLAGVNRPESPDEFQAGNSALTERLCDALSALGRTPIFVLTSSIQAELDNPYGVSKRQAELAIERWVGGSARRAVILRLKNVFGKWCRPNYNSVTATFCHNIARGLPISISDPAHEVDLVYIDDVISTLLQVLAAPREPGVTYVEIPRSFTVTLGELAAKITSFRATRETLVLPAFDDDFTRCLYATYLSYLEGPDFGYQLRIRTDARGSLAEFLKSPHAGQMFVSRTKPGITRGNHYHHTKVEKFLVVEGEAVIRFRGIAPDSTSEVIEHRVRGSEYHVVDIPPGYAHSIENVGTTELVTLFWASEIFDPERPDTFAAPVLGAAS